MKKIAISIVTYKTDPTLLARCLRCIFSTRVDPEVLIIDNSPDRKLQAVCGKFACSYYHNPSNPGYGAAHNIALKRSVERGFKYHLVLNADVSFHGDILQEMIQFMDENPNVGQLMPKVLNPDGSLQRLCKMVPTPADLVLRRFTPKKFAIQMRRRFELWDSGYDKIMFVPYLSGCFMFLRCDALRIAGLFDERFFMYPEDIDLTRRIAIRFDTIFFPHVSVIHEHGAASYKSPAMLLVHMINILKYFNKWGWFFDLERRKLNKKTTDLILGGKRKQY